MRVGPRLTFQNCTRGNQPTDTNSCGGCFTVPQRDPGIYTVQWRWGLNGVLGRNNNEVYSTCVDIKIVSSTNSATGVTSVSSSYPISTTRVASTALQRTSSMTQTSASIPSSSNSQASPSNSGSSPTLCYVNPTLAVNVNETISYTCGTRTTRCPDNMCCSQYMWCGSSSEYCNTRSTGDWRLRPCAGTGTQLCYKSASNLNLDGPIKTSGRCGRQSVGARCADNNCCSSQGRCGSGSEYCTNNQGDWNLIPCTSTNTITPRDGIFDNSTDVEDFTFSSAIKILSSISFVLLLSLF
eukprot:TRINITY_DN11934_c0_g1_i1.p1 TRINITY_DN11934_c0_g1~~TRINITY_DN11934_c0_g1_i1.p1  ORF type:complete len:338 (+),score=35.14 TRINITY_DN11934_c0_g1_i1:127-1014(+)